MTTCVACEVPFCVVSTGIGVESMASFGPYELYSADLLECPGCGVRVAVCGSNAIAQHFQTDYKKIKRNLFTQVVRSWANLREKKETLAHYAPALKESK